MHLEREGVGLTAGGGAAGRGGAERPSPGRALNSPPSTWQRSGGARQAWGGDGEADKYTKASHQLARAQPPQSRCGGSSGPAAQPPHPTQPLTEREVEGRPVEVEGLGPLARPTYLGLPPAALRRQVYEPLSSLRSQSPGPSVSWASARARVLDCPPRSAQARLNGV